ncbi:6a9a6d72-9ad6-4f11-88bb-df7fab04bbf4 [Sclerotinia trifoliorum]|uniref:6a9a6d72-9ad6-4f11-88bb-df7fab04bbf4 n=1 Tax=Sclerotinia trifoliorum TaxID=28548 RepID=A0A8H2ZNR9_9HELO|nr:6a9a6d72-9ad6-4f11-88bb-df7fab04bbf4 [Sclerotinia trifoliorum]
MDAQPLLGNEVSIGVEEKPLKTKVHKVLSSEEWLEFKPIMQRLYIDENETFKVVAGILMSEFGFYPIKRQFTRKLRNGG